MVNRIGFALFSQLNCDFFPPGNAVSKVEMLPSRRPAAYLRLPPG